MKNKWIVHDQESTTSEAKELRDDLVVQRRCEPLSEAIDGAIGWKTQSMPILSSAYSLKVKRPHMPLQVSENDKSREVAFDLQSLGSF